MTKQKLKKALENIQKDFENEVWKKVDFGNKTLPAYEISNYGRIKSHAYDKYPLGKIINGSLVNGYKSLNVRMDNGETQSKYIHKLVAEFFVKKAHKYQSFVIHKDHNKSNNHFENLIWATREELDKHNKKNPVKRGRKPGQKNKNINPEKDFERLAKKLEKVKKKVSSLITEITQMQIILREKS
jgi:hypothetical protein